MWMLAIIITLFAPYWIYIFAPLLKYNVILGVLAGGVYIGMAYGAGCGICEAYIDKVSRASGFEFGRACMFGGIYASIGTFAVSKLYAIDQNMIFWLVSAAGVCLVVTVWKIHVGTSPVGAVYGTYDQQTDKRTSEMDHASCDDGKRTPGLQIRCCA